jgi:hypothetical protein
VTLRVPEHVKNRADIIVTFHPARWESDENTGTLMINERAPSLYIKAAVVNASMQCACVWITH